MHSGYLPRPSQDLIVLTLLHPILSNLTQSCCSAHLILGGPRAAGAWPGLPFCAEGALRRQTGLGAITARLVVVAPHLPPHRENKHKEEVGGG